MPTLIDEGKVFIAESPLYEINHKGQTWFAYTEKEKAAVLAELGDCRPKPDIQRSKGLGENDADMMSLTTMNLPRADSSRSSGCGGSNLSDVRYAAGQQSGGTQNTYCG